MRFANPYMYLSFYNIEIFFLLMYFRRRGSAERILPPADLDADPFLFGRVRDKREERLNSRVSSTHTRADVYVYMYIYVYMYMYGDARRQPETLPIMRKICSSAFR